MYYFAEEGMRLLREYHNHQPFYLRVDFNGPHHPYVVPEPWASLYDPNEIPPWPNFYDTFENKPQVHLRHKFHRGVQDFTWEDWQPAVAKYFGYVSYLDSLFAKLLQTLDDLGIRDETLVIFNTDHGDFTGSHGQFNKGPPALSGGLPHSFDHALAGADSRRDYHHEIHQSHRHHAHDTAGRQSPRAGQSRWGSATNVVARPPAPGVAGGLGLRVSWR